MSDIWEVPLAPSSPGIFTLDTTGVGRAAALNGGNSVNDPSNPVLRGTIVQIYATGEGVRPRRVSRAASRPTAT